MMEGCASHGVPSLATTRAVVAETLDDVIFPGLEHLGVTTTRGRAWREAAFARH